MPAVKDIPGPYRLFFYSFDCAEPAHVHVQENAWCANSGLIHSC